MIKLYKAETLLALKEPALLALIGQVRLRKLEREIRQAVAGICRVADERQQGRLLTALVSLLSSEEVLAMVE